MYTKKEALSDVFEVENIQEKINNWGLKVKVSYDILLNSLAKESYTLSSELSVSTATAVAIVRVLWPDKPHTNSKVCTWLLNKYRLRVCPSCKDTKVLEDFSKNSSKSTGLNTHCKSCYLETTREYQKEYQKTRKLLKLSRVPAWANMDKIRQVYYNCPEGYHVDHIVPLQGKLVSGLHVENNLQYLTAEDNLKKHNKFEV